MKTGREVDGGLTVRAFMGFSHRHVDGDADNSTDCQELEHEIIESTFEHGATRLRNDGVMLVRSERDLALLV